MNPYLKAIRHFNAMVTCGFTSAYFYVKLNKYNACKKMLEERKDDQSLMLPPSEERILTEVMNDLKLSKEVASKIKVFMSDTPDFQSHGSVHNKDGAFLGIPQIFAIDPITKIKVTAVDHNKKESDVKDTQHLEDSLHLSYQAKKFALAHELYEIVNANTNILNLLPTALSLKCTFLSYLLEKVSIKYKARVPFYVHTAIFIMAAGMYIVSFDCTIMYMETKADFSACDLGISYVNGGIEYYTKLMKRNKALKKVDKNAPYSIEGDVNYNIFGKHHMPLLRRVEYLKDIIHSKETKPSVWNYVFFAH